MKLKPQKEGWNMITSHENQERPDNESWVAPSRNSKKKNIFRKPPSVLSKEIIMLYEINKTGL